MLAISGRMDLEIAPMKSGEAHSVLVLSTATRARVGNWTVATIRASAFAVSGEDETRGGCRSTFH